MDFDPAIDTRTELPKSYETKIKTLQSRQKTVKEPYYYAFVIFFGLSVSFVALTLWYSVVNSSLVNLSRNRDRHSDDGTLYHFVDVNPMESSSESLSGDEALYKLFLENLQDRSKTHIGDPLKGYVDISTHNGKVESRRKQMAALDKIRVDSCGPITDEYLEARDVGDATHPSTKWFGKLVDESHANMEFKYYNDTITYVVSNRGHAAVTGARTIQKETFRSFCSGLHPQLPDTMVSIERQGPFYSNGGLDWTQVDKIDDVALMKPVLKGKTIYVVGTFFGIVQRDGKPIDYPPLHVHHAHIHPDHQMGESEKINIKGMPNAGLNHHVMIQTHGDGECKRELGGSDCNLHQLPKGQGYRIVNSSGMTLDYEINDVREAGSKPIEYFVDVVIMWTTKKQVETTFMQIGSPIFGAGWMTYMLPLDSNSNFAYWRYKNSWLGSGEISNYLAHTHMSITDSFYVFKGNNAFDHLEKYRHENLKGRVPYVFECHNTTMEKGKNGILGAVVGSGAELVCEATRPSMQLFCDKRKQNCIYRDSRFEFNCKEKVRLEEDEELLVIAFNKIRNTSSVPLTKQSPMNNLLYVSSFGEGYVVHQHSFFRFDFVSDKARKGLLKNSTGNAEKDLARNAYAPPALFLYHQFPGDSYQFNRSMGAGYDPLHMKEDMIRGCDTFDYDLDLWYKGFNYGSYDFSGIFTRR